MNNIQRYAFAAAAVSLATLCRWLVDGWIGDYVPFVTYFAAVALVGLYAGLGPAVFTAICSGVFGDLLFTSARSTIYPQDAEHWVGLALFLVMCTLIISLTEQVRQSRARRTRELEETNRQKDEFISMLAHELRNPLGAIVNAVEVARLKGGDLPNDLQFAIGIIDRQSAQLKHLVDEILDVARINSGRITLTRSPVDVAEVATECIETTGRRCEDAGVELVARGLDESIWVNGDRARLIQVLTNLLDNACKHTNAGNRISLALERRHDYCELTVADTGVGIDPAKLDHLFEAFFQTQPGEDGQAGGLGLGLHLVKRLVEKHGGTVRAHSGGLGHGAEFIIQLPTVSAPSTEAQTCKHVIGTPGGVSVLIIDDNVDAGLALRTLLDSLGQRAEVAVSGEQGLDRAQALRPQIVFVDIGMPGMDGFEVARRLRKLFGSDIRLLALTGFGQQGHKDQARLAGFDDLIVKPATARVVLEAMGRVAA